MAEVPPPLGVAEQLHVSRNPQNPTQHHATSRDGSDILSLHNQPSSKVSSTPQNAVNTSDNIKSAVEGGRFPPTKVHPSLEVTASSPTAAPKLSHARRHASENSMLRRSGSNGSFTSMSHIAGNSFDLSSAMRGLSLSRLLGRRKRSSSKISPSRQVDSVALQKGKGPSLMDQAKSVNILVNNGLFLIASSSDFPDKDTQKLNKGRHMNQHVGEDEDQLSVATTPLADEDNDDDTVSEADESADSVAELFEFKRTRSKSANALDSYMKADYYIETFGKDTYLRPTCAHVDNSNILSTIVKEEQMNWNAEDFIPYLKQHPRYHMYSDVSPSHHVPHRQPQSRFASFHRGNVESIEEEDSQGSSPSSSIRHSQSEDFSIRYSNSVDSQSSFMRSSITSTFIDYRDYRRTSSTDIPGELASVFGGYDLMMNSDTIGSFPMSTNYTVGSYML